ncbi:MAG: hypothetical protein ORN51_13250 [Akkermansiaceae bacterium]|nr:hypothetical protein [Akkermansiaceae bacterium]
MTNPTHQIDIAERAEFYKVSSRTIYRWLAVGVDVMNPLEVARHSICQRTTNPQALEAILAELDAELAQPLSQ